MALGVIGVVSVVAGFFVALRSSEFWKRLWSGLLFMLVVPVLAGFIAWTVSYQTLSVNDSAFNLHIGFPWAPIDHEVAFDTLAAMEFRQQESFVRGQRRINYEVICHRKQGGSETVPLGDLMKAALDEILRRAQQHNVRILAIELRPW
jgi:hypothetical protein